MTFLRELSGSNLRAREVGEHADREVEPLGDGTNPGQAFDVVVHVSVAEVQPDDVGTGEDRTFERLG